MADDFSYRISTTRFDEHYTPAESSRLTTNFANLARGEHREQNLRSTLTMIERRFNDLVRADNPTGDRYGVELDIVSVQLQFDAFDAASGRCSSTTRGSSARSPTARSSGRSPAR